MPPCPMSVPPILPTVGVLGADANALRAAGLAVETAVASPTGDFAESARQLARRCGVIVVDGPDRAVAARAAVGAGAHAFLTWPPSVSADEAAALAARAEEAGVEVGVARPLRLSGLLAARPDGWTARLVTLTLEAPAASDVPWAHRLAGALDACATLAGSHDPARLEAAAERDGGRLVALAVALRFRNGAYAQLTVRLDAEADGLALYAVGPGGRVEARAPSGPLCIDGAAPPALGPPEDEAVAFVRAVATGRRAPLSLDDALATMRLAERVQARLR